MPTEPIYLKKVEEHGDAKELSSKGFVLECGPCEADEYMEPKNDSMGIVPENGLREDEENNEKEDNSMGFVLDERFIHHVSQYFRS